MMVTGKHSVADTLLPSITITISSSIFWLLAPLEDSLSSSKSWSSPFQHSGTNCLFWLLSPLHDKTFARFTLLMNLDFILATCCAKGVDALLNHSWELWNFFPEVIQWRHACHFCWKPQLTSAKSKQYFQPKFSLLYHLTMCHLLFESSLSRNLHFCILGIKVFPLSFMINWLQLRVQPLGLIVYVQLVVCYDCLLQHLPVHPAEEHWDQSQALLNLLVLTKPSDVSSQS